MECVFLCQDSFSECHRENFSLRQLVLNLTRMIEGSLNSDRFSIIRLLGGWVAEGNKENRGEHKKKRKLK